MELDNIYYNHKLKLDKQYFMDVANSRKTFEIRYNDRNYKHNDLICFCEYDPINNQYTGQYFIAQISYLLLNRKYLQKGYIAFALLVKSCIEYNEHITIV